MNKNKELTVYLFFPLWALQLGNQMVDGGKHLVIKLFQPINENNVIKCHHPNYLKWINEPRHWAQITANIKKKKHEKQTLCIPWWKNTPPFHLVKGIESESHPSSKFSSPFAAHAEDREEPADLYHSVQPPKSKVEENNSPDWRKLHRWNSLALQQIHCKGKERTEGDIPS